MCTILCLIFAVLVFTCPSCTNSDNLALLAGTLKTMQRAACDDEMVSLSCPRGTTINIQVAQYGKASIGAHNCVAKDNGGATEVVNEEDCLWPNPMQYSLLKTVVEACQKKPQCKFSTKSKPDLEDPCPHARKFIEVAYKCRPYEFRSQIGCEDDVIKLSCNPFSRVVIFDAQYGRTAYESITCPQTQGVIDETCKAHMTVERVMQLCHGKRWCQIVADNKTFGAPCKPDTRSYLKVVYACVPLGVLMEKYESAAENETTVIESERDGGLFDETGDVGEKWKEPNPLQPASNPTLQQSNAVKSAPEWNTHEENGMHDHDGVNPKTPLHPASNTRTYIYISIGVLVVIIIVCTIIIVYKMWKRDRSSKNGNMFSTEAPNVFNDTLSDIDNDVDISHISGTFYDPLHPDMILYKDGPGRSTLRAMKPLSTIYPTAGAYMYGNVDYVPSHSRDVSRFVAKESEPEVMMSPKSLSGYSNSQFYYG